MKTTIGTLKEQAAAATRQDPITALKIWWRLVDAAPQDLEVRVRIADLLGQLGAWEAALPVYRACAEYAIQAGHPLEGLVLAKVLEDRGQDPEPLYRLAAQKYAASSPALSRRGGRIAPEHPDTEVAPPDLEAEISTAAVVAGAARAAGDFSRIANYPREVHPIPLLSLLEPEAFLAVCRATRAVRVPAGAMILREGEMGRSFFWLALGSVLVFKRDVRGVETNLARLGPGALFGEMALLQASPRTASVRAETDTDLLEMEAEAISLMADRIEAVAQALDRFARERLLNNLMATSPIFKPFSRTQRLDLLRRFTGHDVAPGTVVIREGDEGRGLYVVLSGEMEVVKNQGGREIPLATLKSGDVFGEISLLKGYPATATVRAAKRSTILFLDRVYFQRLVDSLPEIRRLFEEISEERLQDTQLVLADDVVIEEADELVLI